jgi:hypothetical protein
VLSSFTTSYKFLETSIKVFDSQIIYNEIKLYVYGIQTFLGISDHENNLSPFSLEKNVT